MAPPRFTKEGAIADLPRFAAEIAGLAALRAAGCIRVPETIACGRIGERAVLELEYLPLTALDRASGAELGRRLAALHRHGGPRFGWTEDNFIGATPQENSWRDAWPRFFGEHRLRPQLRRARDRGMNRDELERGERLIEQAAAFFVTYRPMPSLLHGDLWSGNAAALADGTPVIYDPAVYYGDRETDLAMTELFGGFPDAFYAAYRQEWPLDPGYETRKTLYNLYHILNHFNLFGNAYANQARRMIDRLLAELR